jgi:hypothetical protein
LRPSLHCDVELLNKKKKIFRWHEASYVMFNSIYFPSRTSFNRSDEYSFAFKVCKILSAITRHVSDLRMWMHAGTSERVRNLSGNTQTTCRLWTTS